MTLNISGEQVLLVILLISCLVSFLFMIWAFICVYMDDIHAGRGHCRIYQTTGGCIHAYDGIECSRCRHRNTAENEQ